MLTIQMIKLNQDIQAGCNCEKDTDSDSEQGNTCRDEMLKQIGELGETTETETETEESKGEHTFSVDEAVDGVSEIVEGYKKALKYPVEGSSEF